MSFRSPLAVPALALLVALAAASNSSGADRPRGRSIEFSDSKGSEIGTNLNQLGKSDRLKNLEQDLFKPFQAFTPKSSLDGVFVPPQPQQPSTPAIQSKRVRELIERRKNWAFMTAEELADNPSENEFFGIPDLDEHGQEKKKESAMDRFYRKLHNEPRDDNKSDDSINGKQLKKLQGLYDDEDADTSQLPDSLRESELSLKKMSRKEGSSHILAPLVSPNLLTDILGTKEKDAGFATDRAANQKPWMKEFNEMTMPGSLPGTTSLQPLSTLDFTTPATSPSLFAPQPARLPPISPAPAVVPTPGVLGTINAPLLPTLPDASRSIVFPSLNTAPRVEVPRVEPARVPTPSLLPVPQRKF